MLFIPDDPDEEDQEEFQLERQEVQDGHGARPYRVNWGKTVNIRVVNSSRWCMTNP